VFAPDAPGEAIGAHDGVERPTILPPVTRNQRLAYACAACGAV